MLSTEFRFKNRQGVSEKICRQMDGFYVHSNPPKVFQPNNLFNVNQQLLKTGSLSQLEEMVLQGHGHQLIGQYSPNPKIRRFLNKVPDYVKKINELHEATIRGDLVTLKKLKKNVKTGQGPAINFFLSRNRAGVGLLHKAVYYGHSKIVEFLVENYPETLLMKDTEGRTALHYCRFSPESEKLWQILIKAGADPRSPDFTGNLPSDYIKGKDEITLPAEKVLSEIHASHNRTRANSSIPIKPSYIRIWIHDRDLKKLQKIIWEGYGEKLLVETSNNPQIKRFLEGVPHVLKGIKDVHLAVINDNLDEFIKKTSDPVPVDILGSKDTNGLNPLHKASGLGRLSIAKNIVERCKELVHSVDHENRTPLHFAAAFSKSDNSLYSLLVSENADETALDFHGKTPAYYRNNTKEILKYLKVVPEAPRIAHTCRYPWDWTMMRSGELSGSTTTDPVQNQTLQSFNGKVKSQSVEDDETNEKDDRDVLLKQLSTLDHPESYGNEKTENSCNDDVLTENNPSNGNESDHFSGTEKEEFDFKNEEEVSEEYGRHNQYHEIWSSKNIALEFNEKEENENAGTPLKGYENDSALPTYSIKKKGDLKSSEAENDIIDSKMTKDKKEEEISNKEEASSRIAGNKTAWEIGEERQKLLDEGLVKVAASEDGDDEDDSGGSSDGNSTDKDDNVDQIIECGNMKALASMILNGKGSKLLGKSSKRAEIQVFLENVPSYLNKIAAVHRAIRRGSFKNLQMALDRRKFAVAKESFDIVGATPLHTAVLHQRIHIVKYLGGRFPETLNFKDNFGRTPLHYSAVIPDDGHLFNTLLNLGADRKVSDDNGLTPGQYLENSNTLTYEKLLEECNAPVQIARDMLSSQDSVLFGPERGKYLAEALGDPLIRGLIAIANKRPRNPIAYLADFFYDLLNEDKRQVESHEDTVLADPRTEIENCRKTQTKGILFEENSEENKGDKEGEDWEEEPLAVSALTERDEFGQSILHFAAARSHGRTGLFQLIQESGANLGCRDELYRTARDVALQANLQRNMNEIDQYVISLAARGDLSKIKALYLEGYDHIVDLKDEEAKNIVTIASNENQKKTAAFLKAIPSLETHREQMHEAIREGNVNAVQGIIEESKNGRFAVVGKNTSGRCSLHIAVLCQQKEITELLAQKYPETLKIGDNLERTAMHYAMGVDEVETLSKILIKCGAQRVLKDLKGRQPTYYFMNKSEISKLQREECS